MRKQDVVVGGHYTAKVSGKIVCVQIVRDHLRGGWDALNLSTGRMVRIRTAARLRQPISRQPADPFEGLV